MVDQQNQKFWLATKFTSRVNVSSFSFAEMLKTNKTVQLSIHQNWHHYGSSKENLLK